jgi:hypothetical protein
VAIEFEVEEAEETGEKGTEAGRQGSREGRLRDAKTVGEISSLWIISIIIIHSKW